MGKDGVRQILRAGVNDLGGTLMDENISRAAGASHGQMMDAEQFRAVVAPFRPDTGPTDHPLRSASGLEQPGRSTRHRQLQRHEPRRHAPGRRR